MNFVVTFAYNKVKIHSSTQVAIPVLKNSVCYACGICELVLVLKACRNVLEIP